MLQVTSLENISRGDLRDMARAAADRGEQHHEANSFALDTANHNHHERGLELCDPVAA